jgi:hypothetical protein
LSIRIYVKIEFLFDPRSVGARIARPKQSSHTGHTKKGRPMAAYNMIRIVMGFFRKKILPEKHRQDLFFNSI